MFVVSGFSRTLSGNTGLERAVVTGGGAQYNRKDEVPPMRTTHVLVLASALVASGLGFSAIRAQQKSAAGTVVVYKSPT
jgi:hypothetical protein